MTASASNSLILSPAPALKRAALVLCVLALGLSGCGMFASKPSLYPNLRDMPSVPPETSPETERQKILQELDRERDDTGQAPAAPGGRAPAVPPKPADQTKLRACADDAMIAQAVPPLRGTLHGDWRSPAVRPPAGEGVTASIKGPPGTLIVGFAPGGAELTPADAARLRDAAVKFVYQGGESVLIQARSGGAGAGGARQAQPMAGLSIGLKRASAIAGALIDGGLAANRIKIAALDGEDIPGISAASWSGAGPDGAIIIFEPPKP